MTAQQTAAPVDTGTNSFFSGQRVELCSLRFGVATSHVYLCIVVTLFAVALFINR